MTAAPRVGAPAAGHSGGVVRYRLRQSFTYDYDGPVSDLVHRLVVVPPAVHGDQVLHAGAVEVSDAAADVRWHDDAFGNRHCVVRLARVPAQVVMHVAVVVERGTAPPPARPRALARYRRPSALTAPDEALTRLARELAVPGDDLASADSFCAVVRERVAYGYGATHVGTTAAQALAGGTGVCQDQAHVMLALCRTVGIAARYVSGHLVGQGGTHAWTEVLGGDGQVVAYDPCHARRADSRYVTVAVGRDYRDVPPTSGSYCGQAAGQLTTSRLLEPLAA